MVVPIFVSSLRISAPKTVRHVRVGYSVVRGCDLKPILVTDCYVEGDGAANFRRLLRGRAVESWRPMDHADPPDLDKYSAMMISGSAACVTDPVPWMDGVADAIRRARHTNLPVLGICFGHQIVAHALFGEGSVRKAAVPEIGWKPIEVIGIDPLFRGFNGGFTTFVSHFDEVRPGIEGMDVFAQTKDCGVHGYRVHGARIWGVQFHAEMAQKEADELTVIRIEGRPDLGLDVAQTLAESRDSTSLAERMFENFLAVD